MVTGSRGQRAVLASDGLPALEVAEHAKEKEFAIGQIAGIFSAGMQHKWPRRYYIDPFAGPGMCRIKDKATEVDGSPMLAAKSRAKFTDYFLSDKNGESLTTLKQRITRLELPEQANVRYYQGDADTAVAQILNDLPPPGISLGLAVFDPWGWDVAFETIAKLSQGRRLDLVINFPIGYIKRNWERELPALDRFMNGTDYKAPFQAAMLRATPGERPARVLLDAYTSELENIGYKYIQDKVVVDNSRHLPLYCLIFASKHERGTDFWDKVTRRKESGQFRMNLWTP